MTKKDHSTVISIEPKHAIVPRHKRSLAEQQGEWLKELPESHELTDKEIKEVSSTDDVFRSFARQIARIKRLGEDEEYALGIRAFEHNDNDAKKKLVMHNMRLALKMAHQYRRDWTNLMDLVQEASMGMAIAAKKWDPRVGTRFGTYAAYWIRAQLTKFIMTNARLIHTGNTRAGRKVYGSLPQIRRKLLAEGKKPTAELIAKEVNEDPQEVAQILARLQGRETSLSTPIDEEGSMTLEDTLRGDSAEPEHIVTQNEMQRVIKDLTSGFEASIDNERDMAIWRENLIASDPVNLVDLGKRYGVSKQRMGQLATRLKRGFRRHIIEELGPETQLSWLFRED